MTYLKKKGLETLFACTNTIEHSKQESFSRAGFVSKKFVAFSTC